MLPFLLTTQEPGDPVPFGPGVWEWKQWFGLAVYLAVFLLFVYLVYRIARPTEESELPPGESPD